MPGGQQGSRKGKERRYIGSANLMGNQMKSKTRKKEKEKEKERRIDFVLSMRCDGLLVVVQGCRCVCACVSVCVCMCNV